MIRNTITLTALTFTAIAFWILYFDYHNDYNGRSAERRRKAQNKNKIEERKTKTIKRILLIFTIRMAVI